MAGASPQHLYLNSYDLEMLKLPINCQVFSETQIVLLKPVFAFSLVIENAIIPTDFTVVLWDLHHLINVKME